jgi:APA family basic amino acid/polyamine antiporter
MGGLRTKSIEQSIRDTEESEHKLKKDLSSWDLTVFGIGVIIGTGIFVLTGIAAATKAGPAVSLSFVLAGVACALAAPSATPSSPAPSRWPAAPTPSRTPPLAS